ncbi:SemiSWEET transporter [Prosthecomicrobium sp. N25]|uniref:SemiSWEET transporter n=1 Tax=Prosthecomicrobium sp. N25 TaxID=3129254 RepID=UPI0030780C44
MISPLLIELVGSIAAVLTTACWIPQALRVLRSRQASSLSLATFAMLVSGIVLWLTYGLMIQSWPLIASNVVSLVLNGVILGVKIRYG